MACPFAHFSRLTSLMDAADTATQAPTTARHAGPSRLTVRLKVGTAQAHREIEKSLGVRALMGSFHAEQSLHFDRLDHLNFLVMLACVYISMEAVLVQDCNALDDMSGLVMRSDALLSDVQAHLDEVVLTQGASVSDLDRAVEEGAQAYHDRIHALVMPAQAALAGRKMLEAPQLTASHIALLSARQSRAVLSYVDQVMSLQCKAASSTDETSPRPQHHDEAVSFTPTSPQSSTSWPPSFDLFSRPSRENKLILAHAYVRYMGDLSGGQHIVKRLSKLFPIHHASDTSSPHLGFQFYSFASTGKTSMELKEMIRSRMDAVEMDEHDVQMVIDEASLAFCLNRGLLDSLVAEDSTDTPTSMASAVRPASSPLVFLHTLLRLVSSCKALQFALLAIVALASLLLSQ